MLETYQRNLILMKLAITGASGKNVIQTEKDLKRLFPKNLWNKLHLQIIFYGREYCSARGCNGTICNLCKELYPSRKKPVTCLKP